MQQQFSAAPGTNLEFKALSNASPIRGIQIDNPSGSWLFVVSEQLYCPPYTIGWAMPLSYEQASITVRSGNGPSGQVATTQGDNWTLTLNDEAVEPSAGVPYQFTQQFTPNVFTAASSVAFNESNPELSVQLIAGVAGRRIRILSILIVVGEFDSNYSQDITMNVLLEEINLYVNLGGPNPSAFYAQYAAGSLDLPVASDLTYSAAVGWDVGTGSVKFAIGYQLI